MYLEYKFDVEMFDLDIADIWEHERYYFSEFDSNIKIAKITEGIIRTVLIDYTDPISKYTVHDDLSDSLKVFNKQIKYNEYRKSLEKIFELDYFFQDNNMYSYLTSFIVNKGQVDESTFYYVFALKLRQYIYEQVLIQGYLDYQLKTNFNNDHASYKYFLRVLLRQHPYLIYDRDLISTINDYIDTFQSKIQPETFQVRSYLLYEYDRIREEYFIKNAAGFAQVFSDLKKYDFINPGTNKEHFKKIFTFSLINPNNRIIWSGRFVELKWFVQILIDDHKKIASPVAGRWKATLYCFVDKNGTDFEKEETISKASGKPDQRKETLEKILEKL